MEHGDRARRRLGGFRDRDCAVGGRNERGNVFVFGNLVFAEGAQRHREVHVTLIGIIELRYELHLDHLVLVVAILPHEFALGVFITRACNRTPVSSSVLHAHHAILRRALDGQRRIGGVLLEAHCGFCELDRSHVGARRNEGVGTVLPIRLVLLLVIHHHIISALGGNKYLVDGVRVRTQNALARSIGRIGTEHAHAGRSHDVLELELVVAALRARKGVPVGAVLDVERPLHAHALGARRELDGRILLAAGIGAAGIVVKRIGSVVVDAKYRILGFVAGHHVRDLLRAGEALHRRERHRVVAPGEHTRSSLALRLVRPLGVDVSPVGAGRALDVHRHVAKHLVGHIGDRTQHICRILASLALVHVDANVIGLAGGGREHDAAFGNDALGDGRLL